MASYDVTTSQIPSHASSKNCVSFVIGSIFTSGNAVTACLFFGNLAFYLYSKSPKALDKASLPLMRPSCTKLPAFYILASSSGSSGLWSTERSLAVPRYANTVRESPALAQ